MKRLLFVCPNGHIFRSLVKLKNGRLRQCKECRAVTPDSSGCDSIATARKKAGERPWIHVFTKGSVQRRPIRKAA
jgi:hypothetical protein